MTKQYDLFPLCCDHTAAIGGLIFCEFYGNTVIMVTTDGIVKIIAYILGNEI